MSIMLLRFFRFVFCLDKNNWNKMFSIRKKYVSHVFLILSECRAARRAKQIGLSSSPARAKNSGLSTVRSEIWLASRLVQVSMFWRQLERQPRTFLSRKCRSITTRCRNECLAIDILFFKEGTGTDAWARIRRQLQLHAAFARTITRGCRVGIGWPAVPVLSRFWHVRHEQSIAQKSLFNNVKTIACFQPFQSRCIVWIRHGVAGQSFSRARCWTIRVKCIFR